MGTDDRDDDWELAVRGVRKLGGVGHHTPASAPKRLMVQRVREADVMAVLPRQARDKSAQQVDKNTAQRLARGKMQVEARLDLHGCTLEVAHTRLKDFITRAADRGLRCVLVVTGKGDVTDMGDRLTGRRPRGAIRREFPHWITAFPLNQLILKAVPAKPADGGAGAFYVLLRRIRVV